MKKHLCKSCQDTGLVHRDGKIQRDKHGNCRVCNECNIVSTSQFPEDIKSLGGMVQLCEDDIVNGNKIISGGFISIYNLVGEKVPKEFLSTKK